MKNTDPATGTAAASFRLGALSPAGEFRLPDQIVWCGSMVRSPDGRCHLFLSVWPRKAGFEAWVTHSQIGYAVADAPEEEFRYQGLIFTGSGCTGDWDRDVIHNPTVLYHEGRFYLYYMGNYGNGEFWDHRNHQRIGVAVADDPRGPWTRSDRPLLEVTPGGWDSLLTTNPSVCRMPSGRFLMVYKGVGQKAPPPMCGPVLHGVAFADSPIGPFVRHPEPILQAPGDNFSAEDPYVFCSRGKLYLIVKDMHNAYYRPDRRALVLFESTDGIDWRPAAKPLVTTRCLHRTDGSTEEMYRLERPQLYLNNGEPEFLFAAAKPSEHGEDAYNLHLPVTFLR